MKHLVDIEIHNRFGAATIVETFYFDSGRVFIRSEADCDISCNWDFGVFVHCFRVEKKLLKKLCRWRCM